MFDDEPAPPPPPITDDSVVDHLRNFFAGLFGVAHDVTAYAAAMRRGGAVVRVDVDDQPEAARAELAFVKAGAIDITRRTQPLSPTGSYSLSWPRRPLSPRRDVAFPSTGKAPAHPVCSRRTRSALAGVASLP